MAVKYEYWEITQQKLGAKKLSEGTLESLQTCLNDQPQDELYMQIYFQQVYEIFKSKVQIELNKKESTDLPFDSFSDRYDYIFYTVGQSIRPIILSLTITQPKNIIFVHTDETIKRIDDILNYYNNFQKINNSLKLYSEKDIQKLPVHFSDDANVKAKIEEKINELKNSGIPLNKIAFDITGGKKSIVNTLFTVAALFRIDTFYVDFERYENDNPVPGTEFLRLIKNPIGEFVEGVGEIFKKIEEGHRIRKGELKGYNKDLFEHFVRLGYLTLDPNTEEFKRPYPAKRELHDN